MATEQRLASSESHPDSILFFRCEDVNADTEFQPHSHDWGRLFVLSQAYLRLTLAASVFWHRLDLPFGFRQVWTTPAITANPPDFGQLI
ncbi:Uncharacterised protein [Budvicia aquatica]|uniref:AraC family transcriptional regulator n=1 Tax=Budvicia aquatica TaxID=82979 RepID=A0A484ZB33_9GAMM|nr:Uncharacterised protein [Budvicia aquatica]